MATRSITNKTAPKNKEINSLVSLFVHTIKYDKKIDHQGLILG